MDTNQGMLTAAQIITYCDNIATIFKSHYAAFSSLLTDCENFRGVIQGDGTNPSIGNAVLESATKNDLDNIVQSARYERWYKTNFFGMIQDINSAITLALPSGWTSGTFLPLDGWLARINANATGTPSTPTNPIVLTAATTSGGALTGPVVNTSAPYIRFTHVGANYMLESQPSAESTRVALVGGNNSYTGTITGTVPAGVTAINIYRGVNGGASGTEYFDQSIPVTPGANYPSVTIQRPDTFLQTTIIPPSWCSCQMSPSFAYVYGLATATMSPVRSTDTAPLQLTASGMMTPSNVLLDASNAWLGQGNPVTSGQFGTKNLTGAYVPGSIQTANVPANNSQGFAGSTKLRCRASTQLNGTLHPTVSYLYLDAANPTTPQTQTGVTPTSDFVGSITDETVTFTITAGRIVLSVSQTAQTGTANSGIIVYEGLFPR